MINVIAAVSTVVVASGEGAEEMPSVLAVPIDELIIGIIAFLVVFGGLAKFALPSIKKTLEDRTNAIEGGIEPGDRCRPRRRICLSSTALSSRRLAKSFGHPNAGPGRSVRAHRGGARRGARGGGAGHRCRRGSTGG